MFIDTHCHPYLANQKKIKDILGNFKRSGGKYLVSIGTNVNTSQKSIDLSKEYDFIHATVGIHPSDTLETGNTLDENMIILEDYIKNNRENIVGIGETGLDYHWVSKDPEILENQKKIQKEYFIAHINLAKKYDLPIIIHNRDSGDDILKILETTECKKFIIHCFSENIEFANKCFEISPEAKISFSGIVTFKNAQEIAETAVNIPLKSIIIETDAPFLTPSPYRGKEENEPSFTQYVLDRIIELRDETAIEITQQIYSNSLDIYKLSE